MTVPSRTQTHNSTKISKVATSRGSKVGWPTDFVSTQGIQYVISSLNDDVIFSRELINPIGHLECVCIYDNSLSQTMGPLMFGLPVGLYQLSGVCTRFEPNHPAAGSRPAPAEPAVKTSKEVMTLPKINDTQGERIYAAEQIQRKVEFRGSLSLCD